MAPASMSRLDICLKKGGAKVNRSRRRSRPPRGIAASISVGRVPVPPISVDAFPSRQPRRLTLHVRSRNVVPGVAPVTHRVPRHDLSLFDIVALRMTEVAVRARGAVVVLAPADAPHFTLTSKPSHTADHVSFSGSSHYGFGGWNR